MLLIELLGHKEALLSLKLRYVYPFGVLKHLNIILSAVIELQVRDVDDVMETCVVDSLALISVCENVCVHV